MKEFHLSQRGFGRERACFQVWATIDLDSQGKRFALLWRRGRRADPSGLKKKMKTYFLENAFLTDVNLACRNRDFRHPVESMLGTGVVGRSEAWQNSPGVCLEFQWNWVFPSMVRLTVIH